MSFNGQVVMLEKHRLLVLKIEMIYLLDVILEKEMEGVLLEKLGIAAVAGTSFGLYGEGYIRFSYANSSENILRAMLRIREYAECKGWGQA